MKITLRQLEVFAAVASHTQVTRAAQVLSMTQAAASMALAELEQQLGLPLFDRIGRQLLLNDTGRVILPQAREVLDRAHAIEIVAHGADSVFDLHLGASVTIGNHLLPGLLAKLKLAYPNGRLRVSRYNTEQVLTHLHAFQIDLGFIEGPVADERVRRLSWRQDCLKVFAAPGHSLLGRTLTPADLARAEWIVREPGSGTRVVLERACAENGVNLRIAQELEQPEAIRQCVKAGLGIGCLSELELDDALRAGSLQALNTPFLDLRRNLDVVIHRQKFISRGIAAVLNECGITGF